jgi:2,3-dihydroxy-2,3-dihydrophenylpropionate dehydrogenase
MTQLDGQVTLVTGGATGIGRGIVDRFVTEGGRVAVLDISARGLDRLRGDHGDRVLGIEGTVASMDDNQRAVEETLSAFGRLDTLIANAAIFDAFLPLVGMPTDRIEAGFDELFAVNVKGLLLAARAAVDPLIESGGSMIFTASYASFNAAGGGSLYTASKHAVLGLVRQIAYELAPKVRVNGVAPGVAATTLRGIEAFGQGIGDSLHPDVAKNLPLQSIPEPEDYASLFLFLAKKELSKMITGTVMVADSGLLNRGITQVAGGLEL